MGTHPLPARPAAQGAGSKPFADQMIAVVHDHYGTDPAKVLRTTTVPRPTPTPGQVRVKVHAASVDRGTWHIMPGLPYPIRLAGLGVRRPKQLNPRRSVAGTVEEVGSAVTLHITTCGDAYQSRGAYVRSRRHAHSPAVCTSEPAN